MTGLGEVLGDLWEEQGSLDEVVAALDEAQWDTPTASPRWSVTDQIGHLSYFDSTAALAITDPDAFKTAAKELFAVAGESPTAGDDFTLGTFRALSVADRLAQWRENRQALQAAGEGVADDTRIAWYGPSMSAKSFFTARLMEAWAHGEDVCEAVGVARAPTDRLRHIAQLGVITRGWSYINRGLIPPDVDVPDGDVRVELDAPSGGTWTWGESSDNCVRGAALDFCRVVTQRRNVTQTDLEIVGESASEWMSIAQAFAGPATDGPT